jgi:signal transduction histidine kinase
MTETRQLERLRENILATVSHELRTPLTSILGFAVTLKEHGASLVEVTRNELVTHLVEQARRLDRLLSDMLDLDRLRHGLIVADFQATDIGALVRQVALDRPAGEHPILIRAEPVVAEVDATKIEQIVENLLANAIKHTPGQTEVSVRVERLGDSVLVAVDDRGPGIAPHEREGLFELFSRGAAYDSVPGAGVGLSLVAQFAALHDGRAWVEENPGGGASFRVSLPLRQASTRRPAVESVGQVEHG